MILMDLTMVIYLSNIILYLGIGFINLLLILSFPDFFRKIFKHILLNLKSFQKKTAKKEIDLNEYSDYVEENVINKKIKSKKELYFSFVGIIIGWPLFYLYLLISLIIDIFVIKD